MKILEIKRKTRITGNVVIYKVKLDNDVYDRVVQYQWHISGSVAKNALYAQRGGAPPRRKSLHREVVGDVPKEMDVDHINGDTLDNQRHNLRIVTRAQNLWNKDMSSRNTSGFKGVFFNKRRRKWDSRLKANGNLIWVGQFNSPQEAADAYDAAALKYHGEYALTNKMLKGAAK